MLSLTVKLALSTVVVVPDTVILPDTVKLPDTVPLPTIAVVGAVNVFCVKELILVRPPTPVDWITTSAFAPLEPTVVEACESNTNVPDPLVEMRIPWLVSAVNVMLLAEEPNTGTPSTYNVFASMCKDLVYKAPNLSIAEPMLDTPDTAGIISPATVKPLTAKSVVAEPF
jgi:hypothetical protein